MKRLAFLTSAMALILMASTSFAAQETTWGQLKQNVETTGVAAKKGGNGNNGNNGPAVNAYTLDSRTLSATFGAAGGKLTVFDHGPTRSPKDILRVIFFVPPGALDAPVDITMTVKGNTLSDLVIAFAPAGLEFLTPATLMINLGTERIDASTDQLHVEHVHADGTVVGDVLTGYSDAGFADTILADVPGFSRYSTGGGW